MLATEHRDICPYKQDAERWLLSSSDELVVSKESSVLPPYLQSVCRDEFVWQNGGPQDDTLSIVSQRAHEFDQWRQKGRYQMIVPPELEQYWNKEMKSYLGTSALDQPSALSRLLPSWTPTHDQRQRHRRRRLLLPSTMSAPDDDNNISTEPSLEAQVLATLGWSPVQTLRCNNVSEQPSPQRFVVVSCQVCLARAQVAIVDLQQTVPTTTLLAQTEDQTTTIGKKRPLAQEGEVATKRQKIQHPTEPLPKRTTTTNTTITKIPDTTKAMHPLFTHRFFCPYVRVGLSDSYQLVNDTQTGWQRVVSKLVRQRQEARASQPSKIGEQALSAVRRYFRAGLVGEERERRKNN